MIKSSVKYNAAVIFVVILIIILQIVDQKWSCLMGPLCAMCIGVLCMTAARYSGDSKIAEFIVDLSFMSDLLGFKKYLFYAGASAVGIGIFFLIIPEQPCAAELATFCNVQWWILCLAGMIAVGAFALFLII